MKRALGFALTAALVLACADQLPTDVQTAISDGAHGDEAHPGNPDFFFLPPMVGNPSGHPDFEAGKFNGSLAPTVEICQLAATEAADITPETACTTPQPSGFPIVFTTTTGPGSETIRVNPSEEHYGVNWHTDQFNLSATSFYRIRVNVGSFPLGFADVDVVSNGSQLKNVQTGELIGLVDNRTLPIKFRIEEDALCTAEPGEECNASSETVDLGDDVPDQVDLRDEATGDQIGVLAIPPQNLPEGTQVTFTLQQCEALDIDIPQFGDCLRITADPPLTAVVPDGLFPPATISLCRAELIGPQNDLITVHRQDEETGEVFALPHVDDDCEDIIPGPGQQSPNWDVGQQPAGDSPFTSLFRSALPAKMDYVLASDAERTAPAGAELPTAVLVTDANNAPVANARVTFTVTDGDGSVGETTVLSGADGLAQVTWTLGEAGGSNALQASGRGIATPGTNGPGEGFDPFWPGLHEEGVDKDPVLLGTGTVDFTAHPNGVEAVNLAEGGSVDFRDGDGQQIGVLSIPPQEGIAQEVTFTLQQCEQLDIDIPQFGDCLRITATPPLTDVVPDGLFPPATISLCRLGLTEPQNDLITIHRQDEETGEVFALPHVDDDCEDIIPGPGQQSPNWDVGQQPAGDSPFTSLFRSALPAKMDYVLASDAERTAAPGAALPTAVKVMDASDGPVAGAHVTFTVTAGGGSVGAPITVTTGSDGVAQVTWTLGATAGTNTLEASGHGIASPSTNGPGEGFDPFWPGLYEEGVAKDPVLLGTGTLPFTATAVAQPDLVISSGAPVITPDLVAPGGTVGLSAWTITNQGGAVPNTINVNVAYFLSTDATITTADVFLGSSFVSAGMAAGASSVGPALFFVIPAGTAPGSYWIGILADQDNAVAESNEANNFVSTPLTVIPSGLLLRYAFDGDATNTGLLDGFDGTATSVTFPDGKFGQAIKFDGTSGTGATLVDTRNVFGTGAKWTISLWFREDAPQKNETLLWRFRGPSQGWETYHGVVEDTPIQRVVTCSDGGCFSFYPAVGVWHNITYRYDGVSMEVGAPVQIYVDGVLAGSLENSGALPLVGSGVLDIRLGNLTGILGASLFYVDEFRVYNQVFTEAQQCSVVIGGTWNGEGCTLP